MLLTVTIVSLTVVIFVEMKINEYKNAENLQVILILISSSEIVFIVCI